MAIRTEQETHKRAHHTCNELTLEISERSTNVIPFICECADNTCCATVWMTPGEYDAVRAYALPVVAAHHHALVSEVFDFEIGPFTRDLAA